MPQEIEETSRGAHRTDRTDKSHSFAGVVEQAGSVSMDRQLYFLHLHGWSVRILGVGHWYEILGCDHEVGLPRGAGVLAPESLQVDGTDVAAPAFRREHTVKFLIGAYLGVVVVDIAAAQLPVVLDALGQSFDDMRFCIYFFRLAIVQHPVRTLRTHMAQGRKNNQHIQ